MGQRVFVRAIILFVALTPLIACSIDTADHNIYGDAQFDKGIPHFSDINNRKVAWLERGDVEGFPVFYAHGNPGSRLELLFLDNKAQEYGIRLIVLDRPGLGKSPYTDNYGLLDFAEDIEALADEKGIDQFGLLGWSSGGPPVLATAYHLPERARFAISVSGYTNFGEYDQARAQMESYRLRGPELSEQRPVLFKTVVKLARWTDEAMPNFYMKMAQDKMPDYDRAVLNDKQVTELFMRNQKEALEPGIEGAIQDLEVQWAPWPFSLKEIKVPVHLYQGQQDAFVPWKFAQHMKDTIPNASLKLIPEAGHLIPLDPIYQDELFSLMLQYSD